MNRHTSTHTFEALGAAIAFGTGGIKGQLGREVLQNAYDVGFRLFDTAFTYDNEDDLGEVLGGLDDALFMTKLPGRAHGSHSTTQMIDTQRRSLRRDVIDVYLIHWPLPKVDKFIESWEAIIEAKARGVVRIIGVSNFTIPMLDRLYKSTGVLPEVVQFECHPWWPQFDYVDYCARNLIGTIAWSPLRKREGGLLESDEVEMVAAAIEKSPASAVLGWHHSRGVVPIVKSRNVSHMAENLAAVCPAETDLPFLEQLNNVTKRDCRGGDPNVHEEF